MGLRIKKSLQQRHEKIDLRNVKKKIFIVCEGDKTEYRYFEGIKNHSKELGINDLVAIIPLYKEQESKGISHPAGLIKLAIDKKASFDNDNIFYDEEIDKFLIVFDRDREDFKEYNDFIAKYKNDFMLGVSNPCFEIWLLLHHEDAVENLINKNHEEILENRRLSSAHTYISKLVSDLYHMNPKKGMSFLKFKDTLHYAIAQAKKLEQDLYLLENKLGSNIGKIIETEFLMREAQQ